MAPCPCLEHLREFREPIAARGWEYTRCGSQSQCNRRFIPCGPAETVEFGRARHGPMRVVEWLNKGLTAASCFRKFRREPWNLSPSRERYATRLESCVTLPCPASESSVNNWGEN
eukprot:1179047-Prorocentrum_minimum.AAC.1